MKFKSVLFTLFLSVFLAGPALSMQVLWDLGGASILGNDTVDLNDETGLFDQVTFYSETSVIQYDDNGTVGLNPGDSFIDNGALVATGLVPRVDSEILGSFAGANWELTGTMANFKGVVTKVTGPDAVTGDTQVNYEYTSGTLELWAHGDPNYNFNSTPTRVPDEYLDDTGFNDGVKVATFEVVTGVGYTYFDFEGGDINNGGLGEFLLKATFLKSGFWFNSDGDDLSELYGTTNPVEWFINLADYNVDDALVTYGDFFQDNGAGYLYKSDVTHDGSMNFSAVPEPTTMILFGVGLLSIAGISRKKIS